MNSNLCVTNFLIFFINFSNKTDGQTLNTNIYGCTYFGTEVVHYKARFTVTYLEEHEAQIGQESIN